MADKLVFEKLTAEEIHAYMEKKASAEQKAEFKKVAFVPVKKKMGVKQYKPNGEPIMYQLKNKQGELQFDDDGNPIMRQKVKMMEVIDGEVKPVFSLLKAKWWFSEKFPEALEEVPHRKEVHTPSAGDLFAEW